MSNLWVFMILAVLIIVCTFIVWLKIDDSVLYNTINSNNPLKQITVVITKNDGSAVIVGSITSILQMSAFTEFKYEVDGRDEILKMPNSRIFKLEIREG